HGQMCNARMQSGTTRSIIVDSFESTFGVNHLGHFCSSTFFGRCASPGPRGRIVPQLSARTLPRWGYIRAVSFVNPQHAAASLAALMRDETKRYGAGSVIQAVVKGRRGGEDVRLLVTESDTRGYWITGVTCALATEAVLGGKTAPGLAYLCDAVDPVAF